MSRHHSHLNTAVSILTTYDGAKPFAHTLKGFFSGQKKYGSKDRRQIRHLCYSYFRAINVLPVTFSLTDKVVYGFFLSSTAPTPFILELKPEWSDWESGPISDKFTHLNLTISELFPAMANLEAALNGEDFAYSHFAQPQLFVRIRPGQTQKVKQKLDNADISYSELTETALSLANTTQIENKLVLNQEAVIQDYSSQRVAELVLRSQEILATTPMLQVWDCCAASGGKSILAVDTLSKIQLTQSDVRDTILRNLKTRMRQANIHAHRCLTLDLTKMESLKKVPEFDLILADVPCSGSGTWSRTPERLAYFQPTEIAEYAVLQKTITSNISKKLKTGGLLLYITCSVYQQENSEVIQKMVDEDGLDLLESHVYAGMELGADTMFAALLQKT